MLWPSFDVTWCHVTLRDRHVMSCDRHVMSCDCCRWAESCVQGRTRTLSFHQTKKMKGYCSRFRGMSSVDSLTFKHQNCCKKSQIPKSDRTSDIKVIEILEWNFSFSSNVCRPVIDFICQIQPISRQSINSAHRKTQWSDNLLLETLQSEQLLWSVQSVHSLMHQMTT